MNSDEAYKAKVNEAFEQLASNVGKMLLIGLSDADILARLEKLKDAFRRDAAVNDYMPALNPAYAAVLNAIHTIQNRPKGG